MSIANKTPQQQETIMWDKWESATSPLAVLTFILPMMQLYDADIIFIMCRASLRALYNAEGIRGLFKGFSLNVIKGPISFSISLTTFDLLKSWIQKREDEKVLLTWWRWQFKRQELKKSCVLQWLKGLLESEEQISVLSSFPFLWFLCVFIYIACVYFLISWSLFGIDTCIVCLYIFLHFTGRFTDSCFVPIICCFHMIVLLFDTSTWNYCHTKCGQVV